MRTRSALTFAALFAATAVAHSDPQDRVEFPVESRSIDGIGNNPTNPAWGAAQTPFLRRLTADYADGLSSPSGGDRPSARAISNAVLAQSADRPNAAGVSDYVWQWGQFLDHDITETPVADPAVAFDIEVPFGDPQFDPFFTGTELIGLDRSYVEFDGSGVAQQVNEITAYIDASNVYGADLERANELRTLDGTGRLKTSAGDLLPFNDAGLANAPTNDAGYFLAGDFRCNEQVALTALHTLFVREHNYWADRIAQANADAVRAASPAKSRRRGGARSQRRRSRAARRAQSARRAETDLLAITAERALTGDEIYQAARTIVAAEMQAITYREFLPVLLGKDALPAYQGYRDDVDAGISNAFSTAAYRVGHTMLSPQLRRLNRRGKSIEAGDLSLAASFFVPQEIVDHGIEPLLRGLAAQRAQEVDAKVIDEIRNFLFGPPGAGGFDLASLNIQRGRDHGLPSYNQARRELGLAERATFDELAADGDTAIELATVYDDVEQVDLWVGGLAEAHVGGGLVGETFAAILTEQFSALRDGDRFWYQSALSPELVSLVEKQNLARIIRRNTRIGRELRGDLWHVR